MVVLKNAKARVILQIQDGLDRGVNFMLALRRQGCDSAVILLTNRVSDYLLDRKSIIQGVSSIFKTSAGIEALLEAIRMASLGITTFNQEYLRSVNTTQDRCTPRDHRVKALLLEGLANKEIGVRLGISEGAVKKHFQRIFRVLGVHSRSEVVRVLLARQLSAQRLARTSSLGTTGTD